MKSLRCVVWVLTLALGVGCGDARAPGTETFPSVRFPNSEVPVQPGAAVTPSPPPPPPPPAPAPAPSPVPVDAGVVPPTEMAGAGAAGAAGAAGSDGAMAGPWPAASGFDSAGSFATQSGAEGPACMVHRPATLGEEGRQHPMVVWGNGTFNTPSSYTSLFDHLASHGFIVIAANTSNSGSGSEMIACLDYMLAESVTPGSVYEGVLDPDRIAASGYSQGGGGTLMAARDPRFVVSLPVAPYLGALGGFERSSVGEQIHPMFLLSGSSDTTASPASHQQPVFNEARVPIVWGTVAGAGHLEVLGSGGRFRGPMTAWLRSSLMDDAVASALFDRASCGLCAQPGWSVQHNELWQ